MVLLYIFHIIFGVILCYHSTALYQVIAGDPKDYSKGVPKDYPRGFPKDFPQDFPDNGGHRSAVRRAAPEQWPAAA